MAYVIPVLVYISAAFNTKYDINSNIRPDILALKGRDNNLFC